MARAGNVRLEISFRLRFKKKIEIYKRGCVRDMIGEE